MGHSLLKTVNSSEDGSYMVKTNLYFLRHGKGVELNSGRHA